MIIKSRKLKELKYQLLNEINYFYTESQVFYKFNLIFIALFAIILIYISIIDIKSLSIGLKELIILLIFTITYFTFKLFFSGNMVLFDIFKGIIFSLLFFLIIILLTKNKGIGIGDMIFFSLCSINIGFINSLEAILIAFILGMIYSIFLILLRKANLKTKLPFIPFLSIGILLSLFFKCVY